MSATTRDSSGLRTTGHAGEHEDYTSLKRSLSAISAPRTKHPEHIVMEGSQFVKPRRRLKVNVAYPKVTEIAFAALQNLPIPLLVLSSLKTIVLANEAMGRLLGLRGDATSSQQQSVMDVLKGQTLSQIGIDMLQDGVPLKFQVLG
jgi:PAS domain-containing protein